MTEGTGRISGRGRRVERLCILISLLECTGDANASLIAQISPSAAARRKLNKSFPPNLRIPLLTMK